MPASRLRVFVSYRRSDSSGQAGRLHDRLAQRYGTASIFIDVDSVQYGADFRLQIENTLADADVVLIVIGPAWLAPTHIGAPPRLFDDGDLVRIEVVAALESGAVVIPVLVGGASMPATTQVPPEISRLTHLHGFRLSDQRFHRDATDLLDLIDRFPGRRPIASELPKKSVGESASGLSTRGMAGIYGPRRKLALAAAIVGGLIAITTLAVYLALPPKPSPVLDPSPKAKTIPAVTPAASATPSAGGLQMRRHPSSLNVAIKQTHDHARAFGPQATSVIWASFVGSGDDVVTTTNSGDVTLWKPKSGEIAQRFVGTTGTYSYSFVNVSRGWIATPGLDGSCHVWSLRTGQRIATIPVGGRASSVAFLPQRQLLACASESDGVVAMNENGWQEYFRISPSAGFLIRDIALFRDGRVVGVGEKSNKGAALVSSGNSFAELGSSVRQENAMIRVVSCVANGSHVFATAGQDGTARIYRVSDGFQLQSFGHRSTGSSSAVVNSVEFSNDCNFLLTASLDGTVRIWDITNGSQRHIFEADAGHAWSAKFSPDQSRILATYEEGCAVVWSIKSGQKVAVMGEHSGRVMYGVFSSDGQKAVTTSLDGTALVWTF